ncbi:MAG TPA: DUF4169 family protein [Rhizomicrobium sp.]
MGELINLRRAKKTRALVAREKTAAAHRAVHGTPKHLRRAAKLEKQRVDHTVDAHKIDAEK